MTSSAPDRPDGAPLLIINPRAGGGRGGRFHADVRAIVERSLGPVHLALTERPEHATELARGASLRGCPLIIAGGGDGTLHEVANGVLLGDPRTRVGYIGLGTGGDFRKTLGTEHRLDRYVESLASGAERAIDVGKVTYRKDDGTPLSRYFLNILSVGMGGLVDLRIARTTRAFGSTAAYYWASLLALSECRRGRVTCDVGLRGERFTRQVDAYMIAVCNGRFFGSGMHVAPMASPDDGRFEVVAMDAPSKLAFAAFSRAIYRGEHLTHPGVVHFACDSLRLDVEDEDVRRVFLLDVDGEPLGKLPIAIELVPRALILRG